MRQKGGQAETDDERILTPRTEKAVVFFITSQRTIKVTKAAELGNGDKIEEEREQDTQDSIGTTGKCPNSRHMALSVIDLCVCVTETFGLEDSCLRTY